MVKINTEQIKSLKMLEESSESRLLEKLIDMFEIEAIDNIKKMQDSLMENDLKSLSAHAHKFKSTCQSLGADEMADICLVIEANARQKMSMDYEELIASLENNFPAVVTQLKTYI